MTLLTSDSILPGHPWQAEPMALWACRACPLPVPKTQGFPLFCQLRQHVHVSCRLVVLSGWSQNSAGHQSYRKCCEYDRPQVEFCNNDTLPSIPAVLLIYVLNRVDTCWYLSRIPRSDASNPKAWVHFPPILRSSHHLQQEAVGALLQRTSNEVWKGGNGEERSGPDVKHVV